MQVKSGHEQATFTGYFHGWVAGKKAPTAADFEARIAQLRAETGPVKVSDEPSWVKEVRDSAGCAIRTCVQHALSCTLVLFVFLQISYWFFSNCMCSELDSVGSSQPVYTSTYLHCVARKFLNLILRIPLAR